MTMKMMRQHNSEQQYPLSDLPVSYSQITLPSCLAIWIGLILRCTKIS